MRSMFDYIVTPLNERYNNTVDVDGKELIINTKIESFKSVSNLGVVTAIPLAYKTEIEVGDIVIIHHNVFRRFYSIKGEQKNSRSYFTEDLYFCSEDQIYLYNRNDKWYAFGDRCFVKPIKNTSSYSLNKENKLIGILKYGNDSLNKLEINPGDLVGYTPNGEYDFVINKERLYCMKSNDIVIKYEYKGDEAEYNPKWLSSSGGINKNS